MRLLSSFGALFASISLLASTPLLFAQDNEAAPPATDTAESQTAEEAKPTSSQEVEINEDTYRQFMELKDANRQGDIIPETVFKPGSGLQKLEKLPEESQKHLRNELREIIVQGDPWQPGDEAADYPYTPSAAASMNPALQKQELEAWGELVDSYNQREAQIYADRAGNRAAMNPQDGQGGQPGDGADKEGKDGEDKEGVPGQPSEQDGNPAGNDTAGAFSPDAVHDPNAQGASGVSQNALEFLQGLGGTGENQAASEAGRTVGSNRGSSSADDNAQSASATAQADGQQAGPAGGRQTAQNSGQGSAQGQEQAEGEQAEEQGEGQAGSQTDGETLANQQSETAERKVSVPIPDDDFTFTTSEPEQESTAGTTQNALEFLGGDGAQTDGGAAATSAPPAGTLNIQDLLNAQGVGGSAGASAPTPDSDEGSPRKDGKTDIDGGGT